VSVLEQLGGHGIGRTIHEPPSVPNVPDPADATRLHSGLVITIEPILGAGGAGIRGAATAGLCGPPTVRSPRTSSTRSW
jgi:methionine aminopeptidase